MAEAIASVMWRLSTSGRWVDANSYHPPRRAGEGLGQLCGAGLSDPPAFGEGANLTPLAPP